jgi:hypothetical protein
MYNELVQQLLSDKDKSNQRFYVFVMFCILWYWFSYEGKAHKDQIRFVTYPFQDLPLGSSTLLLGFIGLPIL